jgi:hypothetical protein
MKATTILSVESAVLTTLTDLAHAQRVSRNVLITRYITEGLERDSVKVESGPNPSPLHEKLSRKEEAVMRGMKALQEQNDERHPSELEYRNVFFTLKQISRAAGFYPSVALQALRTLEHSGRVRCDVRVPLVSDPSVVSALSVEHWVRVDVLGVKRPAL